MSTQAGWAVSYESHAWEPSAATGRLRDMLRGEYQSAVPVSISERSFELASETKLAAVEAAAAITRFDAEVGLSVAPFAALLLRSESSASSQIENLTASAKAVLMAEAGDTSRANASLVAANTAAMGAAIELAESPNATTIIEMHRALMEASTRRHVGRWRDEQVWIGGTGASPHNAAFVPPHHSRVPELMSDLSAFMQRIDVEPFTHALIAHAQFETIHPFPDGNGRTGRALIHAHLAYTGVAQHVTVPISAGLLTATDRYFEALTRFRQGEIDPIVELGAAAAHRAIGNGRQLAEDITATRAAWAEKTSRFRADSVVHRVVAHLVAHPVINAADVQRAFEVSAPAAHRAIDHLVSVGVLKQANAGVRFRKFFAHDIATALDAFAERAGRRAH